MRKFWEKVADWNDWIYRPIRLLLVVSGTILIAWVILDYLNSPMFDDLIHPRLTPEKLSEGELKSINELNAAAFNYQVNKWRSLSQTAALIVGLPVAFVLWNWRDRNARDQIESAKRDVSLKEFQEVQARAAGAMQDNIKPDAVEVLQIAALHQLRIFLGTKNGEVFQRPALELLLAGHTTAMDNLKTGQLQSIPIGRRGNHTFDIKDPQAFQTKLKADKFRVTRERMGILREEVNALVGSKAKLVGRNFDLLDLKIPRSKTEIDFSRSSFFGSNLQNSELNKVNFSMCRLQGTDLRRSNWQGALSFKGAYFDQYTQLNESDTPWNEIDEPTKLELQKILMDKGGVLLKPSVKPLPTPKRRSSKL
jgi:hypothetical protein